jgi:hypothetical protein
MAARESGLDTATPQAGAARYRVERGRSKGRAEPGESRMMSLPPHLPPDPQPDGIPSYGGNLYEAAELLQERLISKGIPIFQKRGGWQGCAHKRGRLYYLESRNGRAEYEVIKPFYLRYIICEGIKFRRYNYKTKK